MDISAVASLATQMSQQRTAESASLLLMKKAMEMQKTSAQALLAALPTPASALPPHLGQNVNTVA